MGIFAGSGVGKSTLLGMMARGASSDVNVIALVGERGRELREFIEKDLGEKGLERSVIVVATSDQPALVRLRAAFAATTVAEYFRDQGRRVLFMMDSVTRFAMAQREVGLAVGEPPSSRGYTPSVFALLPRLMERTGAGAHGSITAFYTVLVEGDDMNEPIADAVRGILDGHVVLTRALATANHFPAIDVLESVSRLNRDLCSDADLELVSQARDLLSLYRRNEDLITIGAYTRGANPRLDLAIERNGPLNAFLRQPMEEISGRSDSWSSFSAALS
jgi:flagellum-specific ATP synthase